MIPFPSQKVSSAFTMCIKKEQRKCEYITPCKQSGNKMHIHANNIQFVTNLLYPCKHYPSKPTGTKSMKQESKRKTYMPSGLYALLYSTFISVVDKLHPSKKWITSVFSTFLPVPVNLPKTKPEYRRELLVSISCVITNRNRKVSILTRNELELWTRDVWPSDVIPVPHYEHDVLLRQCLHNIKLQYQQK